MNKPRALDFSILEERIKTQDWAGRIYRKVRNTAESMIARGVVIFPPENPSGWMHDYTCPRCAELLEFDLDSPKSHRCKLCGGRYSTPVLDAAWVYRYNLCNICSAEQACFLAGIDKDLKAGQWAREILLGYTAMYASYPEHGSHAGKGKIQAQSLDEAVWMIPAVRVYQALTALDLLSEADGASVRERLFVPATELLRRQTHAVHNIHVWHASAIWAMGNELGSQDDVDFAEKHLIRNVMEGVLPDGSWFEGSPHYHFYTVAAFTSYLLAARAAGCEPIMSGQMRKMFSSPLLLLQPNLNFPAFNDGWPTNPLDALGAQYEIAQYLFGGFEGALHTIYRVCGKERDSEEALLYGPDEIPDGELELPRLTTVDGVAIARRKSYVGYVKSTPNGGGHDHDDKPSLYILPKTGDFRAADIGNPGYGNPLHAAYYKTSHAHNTVIVNDEKQARAGARIISAQDCTYYSLVTSENDGAYPGVQIRRSTFFGEDWVIDRTLVTCEAENDLLWLFHTNGSPEFHGKHAWRDEAFTANPHFSNQRLVSLSGPEARLVWRTKDGREEWRTCLHVSPGASIGTAEAPDLPATNSVGVLAVRLHGQLLDVCMTIILSPEAPEVSATIEPGGKLRATVHGTPALELSMEEHL